MADRPSDAPKLGRNDPCHCGSGQKYKKCHEAADDAARAEKLAKEQAALTGTLDADEAAKLKRESDAAARHGDFQSRTRASSKAPPPQRARKRTP
jgi:uncharacterized protein YecA (UPF0149 family)